MHRIYGQSHFITTKNTIETITVERSSRCPPFRNPAQVWIKTKWKLSIQSIRNNLVPWCTFHAHNAFKMFRNYRLQGVPLHDARNSTTLDFCCCSMLWFIVNWSSLFSVLLAHYWIIKKVFTMPSTLLTSYSRNYLFSPPTKNVGAVLYIRFTREFKFELIYALNFCCCSML